jgi:hypothetical protein
MKSPRFKYGKTPTGRPKKEPKSLVNFKVSAEERAELVRLAERFTEGKISAYIRMVALDPFYRPSPRAKR